MDDNEIRHRARIVRRFGDVPKVDANEARLGQVFLNLIVNAAHAIPEGKTDANAITITTRRAGDTVAVEVADTGNGIPPEVLPRIFDVFFTTKPIGVGTGLGLSICHRIVAALNGRIDVDSQVGQGTKFTVTLPQARAEHGADKAAAEDASLPARSRSVLVVEDEAAIGRTLQRLLVPHRVTVNNRAREALQRITSGERYDVILCDVMMPEMTGMDFYRELRAFDEALSDRVIFMSGGTFTENARTFLDAVPNHRVDKPMNVAKLRVLIEETAAASAGGMGRGSA
jgi:CheY-like chemotaxis protein